MQLYYESLACKTTLINYCVVCFNGKFGWVPFIDQMVTTYKQQRRENLPESDFLLNYDDISYTNALLSAEVPFKFSDSGLSTLCQAVGNLPPTKSGEREFILILGTSIEDLHIEELYKLVLICGPSTNLQINLVEEKFNEMIDESRTFKMVIDLKYTEETVTVVSKLLCACAKDTQKKLVRYLLNRNKTLINVPFAKNVSYGEDNRKHEAALSDLGHM